MLYKTRTTRTPAFWDTLRGPMITNTSDSHQIPSQDNTQLKLQIYKNCQKLQFWHFAKTFHTTHLLKLLDRMYKYEMDPTRTVGATEQTRDAGWTDGRMDGRTNEVKQYTPLTTSLCGGYKDQNKGLDTSGCESVQSNFCCTMKNAKW